MVQQADRLLKGIKWFLWNGTVFRAQQSIDELDTNLDLIKETHQTRKLLKPLREPGTHIDDNALYIPNDGIGIAMAKKLRRALWSFWSTKSSAIVW